MGFVWLVGRGKMDDDDDDDDDDDVLFIDTYVSVFLAVFYTLLCSVIHYHDYVLVKLLICFSFHIITGIYMYSIIRNEININSRFKNVYIPCGRAPQHSILYSHHSWEWHH
ncbi:hypothetical protein Dimus_029268 [Dionaea muscipula]